MIKAMFELYDFIIKNQLTVYYVDWEGVRDNEITILISPIEYAEFTTIITEHFEDLMWDDGYQIKMMADGSLLVDIMPLIEHYCMIEDVEIWETRYKQLGEGK